MSNHLPVMLCENWDQLYRAFRQDPDFSFLSIFDTPEVTYSSLTTPVVLVRGILADKEGYARVTAGSGGLRLLVLGAENIDAHLGGFWYSLVPKLIGQAPNRPVDLFLVGERLDVEYSYYPNFNSLFKTPETVAFTGSVSSFL